ncbi:MAG: pitrilysin family protein [Clostridia bacterium]|nr:pitrilysin family protein [Clostridia bacterium]
MTIEHIKSPILDEEYIKIIHSSGLTIYSYPKKDYNSSYAMFGTKFGSINTSFIDQSGNKITTPDGIAHYLEHKLFESEDGDAFSKFAQTGASANAYTAFDKTMYLFSCSDNFITNLEFLLDFVQNPYFTKETVEKEQGIISQEIRMYDDSPDWRALFNLLNALYVNHSIKKDIAGTVESISQITPELLYTCYNNFYNLNNMVLVVVGNINTDEVIRCADKFLKKSEEITPSFVIPEEPDEINMEYIEQKFPVSIPLFQLGFKENIRQPLSEKQLAATDVLTAMLFGESSMLYKQLEENKLINNSFSFEHFESDSYSALLIGGESRNPKKATELIKKYVQEILTNGLDEEEFLLSKRSTYGDAIASFNSIEGIGNIINSMHFTNREIYKYIDTLSKLTLEDVENRLREQFSIDKCALSVILPSESEG